MTEADLPLMHEWLQREHVRRWWDLHETFEEVAEHYLPSLEGRRATDLYLILLGDRPVGFIQTYLVSDYPEHAERIGLCVGVAGVDLFIADEELTGQGLGPEVLRAFAAEIVFDRRETTACVADPDVRNQASIRAFEKAGFCTVREFFDPGDGQTHCLLRLDRE
jgi:RimJ/RimL family protein N-acetyltransferase